MDSYYQFGLTYPEVDGTFLHSDFCWSLDTLLFMRKRGDRSNGFLMQTARISIEYRIARFSAQYSTRRKSSTEVT